MGSAGLAGIGIAILILGRTGEVRGNTATDSTTSSTSVTPGSFVDPAARDPFAQYPSPGAIAYENLTAGEKAAVDVVQEAAETSQPAASNLAFAQATAWTSGDADRQLAERQTGLVDTADDGVVP